MSPLEQHLVQRAATGDAEACSELWALHRRWLATVVLAHVPSGVEIEDVLQEVAMRLLRGIGSLDNPKTFPSWIRTVAIHATVSVARRANVRNRLVATNPYEDEATPEHVIRSDRERAEQRESLEHTLALLQRLPNDYREALMLRAIDGMSQREIAATLALPVTTIESRLARARRMLREMLEAERTDDVRPVRTVTRCS